MGALSGQHFFIEKFSKTYSPPVADSNLCSVSRMFVLYQKFFVSNSIFGKLYIFSIKNNFRFQKNFLKCNEKFSRSKISTFLSKNSSNIFFKKSPKNFFQSDFWLKCEKKLASASAVAGKNIN